MQGSGCRRGSGFCFAASETSDTQLLIADGVDNLPRDPVRHTSVSGHAVKKLRKMPIVNVYWPLTQQAECDKQESDKLACKRAGVIEEQVSAMQSSKTPATNSSSADGVDDPPRDPVCHTSVSGHAVKSSRRCQL